MNFTQEQLTKARQAKSAEELLTYAKEISYPLSEEEAKKFFAELNKKGDLADKELDNVAGGGCGDPEPTIYTAMLCDNCGCNTYWIGNYVNQKMYKCPLCEHETFHGTVTTDRTGW